MRFVSAVLACQKVYFCTESLHGCSALHPLCDILHSICIGVWVSIVICVCVGLDAFCLLHRIEELKNICGLVVEKGVGFY